MDNNDSYEVQEEPTPPVTEEVATVPVEEVAEEPKPEGKPYSAFIDIPSNSPTLVGTDVVALPATTLKLFVETLERFKEYFDSKDALDRKWLETNENAVDYYSNAGIYQEELDDPKREWRQGITDSEGKRLGTDSIKFNKEPTGELRGEVALLKVTKALGLGEVVNIILPHSGIWVSVKPPTERALIDFYNTTFREKVAFGNATSGLSFSNYSTWMNKRIFEFIQEHIYGLNYSDISKDQLGNYMVSYDFDFLVHGFAKAMYPSGFDHSRACSVDPEACRHVSVQALMLESMEYIDNKALTPVQMNILRINGRNKHTVEAYRTYQANHSVMVKASHTCSNGIKLNFKIPTFNEQTTDGIDWINKVSTAVEDVLITVEDPEKERQSVLASYIKATVLRQFSHFVESIDIDEESTVVDRETINSILAAFSADDDLRTEITRAIVDFKLKTTIGVIGIDEYECPACKKTQVSTHGIPAFKTVIPLDTVSLYFLMKTFKISKILDRSL